MEIKREREAYKHALKNCKTKDEVERLNTNKMNQFLSQAKTISSNPQSVERGEKSTARKDPSAGDGDPGGA